MKILTKNNIKGKIKFINEKAIPLLMVTTMLLSAPGCNNKEKNNISPEWSYTITALQGDKEFIGIGNPENLDTNILNNYEIGLFENETDGLYYRIIDKNGSYLDNEKYTGFIKVNESIAILENEGFTLINLNTGDKTPLPQKTEYDIPVLYEPIDNSKYFLSTLNYSYINEISNIRDKIAEKHDNFVDYLIEANKLLSNYKLYNSDGTLARDNSYTDICYDKTTNRIFLNFDNEIDYYTEIIDVKTAKSKVIEGINVKEALDGYFIAEDRTGIYIKDNHLESSEASGKDYVYYMENFEDEPKIRMPKVYGDLTFLKAGDTPIFLTRDTDSIVSVSTINIVPVISKEYQYIFSKLNTYPLKKDDKITNYAITETAEGLTIINDAGQTVYENIDFNNYGVFYLAVETIIDENLLLTKYQVPANSTEVEIKTGIFSLQTQELVHGDLKEIIPYYDENDRLKLYCLDSNNNSTIYDTKKLSKEHKHKPIVKIFTKNQ